MSNLHQLRQKIQESKRTCLLRKIRFYEYLINYNTHLNPEKPVSLNKTTNSFFPHINYHAKIGAAASAKVKETPRNQDDTHALKTLSSSIPTSATSPQNSQGKENCGVEEKKISALVAKSMTPSTRIHQPSIQSQRGTNCSIRKERGSSTISTEDKISRPKRRSSPRKRTYIGGAYYVKEKSLCQPIMIKPGRKESLAPWDIDM